MKKTNSNLIEIANPIDLHTHTVASGHAYSTLTENILSAKAKGMRVIGASDHAPKMPGSTHEYYFSNMRILPEIIEGVRVLKGVELNVLNVDGDVDLDERSLTFLDYGIASLHIPCFNDLGKELNTTALINAMDYKKVKIIGHPDDGRFPLNYARLVNAAKSKGILLEMNNSSLSPHAFRENARENYIEMLSICKEQAVEIIINSDCHYSLDIGNYEYALELIDAVDFPHALVVNFNGSQFWEKWE